MPIPIQTIEWLLTFLLGLEAFQMELVLLLLLFFATVLMRIRDRGFVVYLNSEFVFLTFSFLFYFISLYIQSRAALNLFSVIRFLFGASISYLIGTKICKSSEHNLVTLIQIIAYSSLLHGFFNLLTTTTFSTASRYVHNVWTGGITTATLQGTYFTCAIAVAAVFVFEKSIKRKIVGVLILIIVMWNSMMTASRTAIYLILIMFPIAYFLREYGRNRTTKSILKTVVRTILGISVIAILLWKAYSFNLFGIQTRYVNSFLGLRMAGISKELTISRNEAWWIGLKDILAHPFGYNKNYYAHNLWLDYGLNGGILPFVLLVAFSISSLFTCGRLIKHVNIPNTTKSIVILSYIAFNANFMLEPILDGVPFMFFMYCMICGAVQNILHNAKIMTSEAN